MNLQKNKEEKTSVIKITTNNFDEIVTQSDLPVLLDLWAPRCSPCRFLAPYIDELSIEFQGKILFGKINVDENRELSRNFNIRSIPTLIFMKKNKEIGRHVGMIQKRNLKELLEKWLKETDEKNQI